MGIVVSLDRQEISRCRQAASLRWQLARAAGVGNQRRDSGRSDADVDELGVKAEYAVSKVFRIPYDFLPSGIDDGVDLWLEDIGIDVKSTFHRDGYLLFKRKEAFRADVSVLVTQMADDLLDVVGWIDRDRFNEHAEEKQLTESAPPGFVVPQSKLLNLGGLWTVATKRRVKAA